MAVTETVSVSVATAVVAPGVGISGPLAVVVGTIGVSSVSVGSKVWGVSAGVSGVGEGTIEVSIWVGSGLDFGLLGWSLSISGPLAVPVSAIVGTAITVAPGIGVSVSRPLAVAVVAPTVSK